jgi:hypothetical protein
MCLPLGVLAIGAGLAGTAMSAVGQIQAGKYNAAVADQNARNLDRAALDAENRGDYAAAKQGVATQRILGSQRAAAGAMGIDMSSGSALDILVATAGIGEEEAQTIRNNAAREAWGLRSEAAQQRVQGRLARRQGILGGATTILTGLASAGGSAKAGGYI